MQEGAAHVLVCGVECWAVNFYPVVWGLFLFLRAADVAWKQRPDPGSWLAPVLGARDVVPQSRLLVLGRVDAAAAVEGGAVPLHHRLGVGPAIEHHALVGGGVACALQGGGGVYVKQVRARAALLVADARRPLPPLHSPVGAGACAPIACETHGWHPRRQITSSVLRVASVPSVLAAVVQHLELLRHVLFGQQPRAFSRLHQPLHPKLRKWTSEAYSKLRSSCRNA
mmetsp:Transcript_19061/g.36726  ORF Transcript_19061/g.36726 Transcript_19061/m.36726 type:complete len:226 (+) Transcript_19061:654-1331(+)